MVSYSSPSIQAEDTTKLFFYSLSGFRCETFKEVLVLAVDFIEHIAMAFMVRAVDSRVVQSVPDIHAVHKGGFHEPGKVHHNYKVFI